MQLILHARDGVHATIRNLSFPATAVIEPAGGAVRCSHRGLSRLFGSAQRLTLRPFTPIALDLGIGAAVIIELPFDLAQPDDTRDPASHEATGGALRPLTRLLARHVLAAPQRDWTLDTFAAIAGLSRTLLSRRLFAEGASFREVVRTHRLTRLLIELPQLGRLDHALAIRYGFTDRCQLENAVFDQFGMPLGRLQRLVASDARSIPSRPVRSRKNPAPQYRWHPPTLAAIQCDRPPGWAQTPCLP